MTATSRIPRSWHRFDVYCECAACARYESSSPYQKVYSEEHVAFERESTRKACRALWFMWLGVFGVILPATFALSCATGVPTPFAGALLAAVATGAPLAGMTSWWHFRSKQTP